MNHQHAQSYLQSQESKEIIEQCYQEISKILNESKERMDFLLSSFVLQNHKLIPHDEYTEHYYNEIKNNYQQLLILIEHFKTKE